jgi:hypothetical protein
MGFVGLVLFGKQDRKRADKWEWVAPCARAQQ